ncbi:MAG TPA: gluconokinase [Candidatus Acidoferrum sp.]|nr:gluconokinase [Candidatus Acidoferrum sp.]
MVILMMGTTGAGKTTVGTLLARRLGWQFVDGDDFHPAANVEKMRQGVALTDADRAPWLAALHDKIIEWQATAQNVILACSALKESYRRQLLVGPEIKLVYLKGTYELFSQRVLARKSHFAKQDLIASQFAALEEPSNAVVIDTAQSLGSIVADICRRLALP